MSDERKGIDERRVLVERDILAWQAEQDRRAMLDMLSDIVALIIETRDKLSNNDNVNSNIMATIDIAGLLKRVRTGTTVASDAALIATLLMNVK